MEDLALSASDLINDLASYKRAGLLKEEPASLERVKKSLIQVKAAEGILRDASDQMKKMIEGMPNGFCSIHPNGCPDDHDEEDENWTTMRGIV